MTKSTRIFLLMLPLLSITGLARTQQNPPLGEEPLSRFKHKLGTNAEYGFVMPTNEYLRGEYEGGTVVKNFGSLSVYSGWETRGDRLWHRLYGNPAFGIGIYHSEFGRPEDLGAPWAVFGYYEGPFKRWEKFSVNYHFRMGISMGWKPFDAETNPYQISLGSSRAIYANLRFDLQYQLSRHINLNAGISFAHFSNGSTVKPNKGINLIAPSLGMNYYFRAETDVPEQITIPAYQDNWEWLAAFTFGQKQVVYDTTNSPKEIDRKYIAVDYNIFGLTSTLYRQVSHKSKIGAGFDLLYDESINASLDIQNGEVVQNTARFADQIAIGIYPSYELVVNNLSFLVQGGGYIIREKRPGQIPAFYQRLGMKYHIFKNLFVGINIKAYNMKVADFIEWNAGYRLKWTGRTN
jgi:hypothetical protein